VSGSDGLHRPRERGIPKPKQLHAKVTAELFDWVHSTARAAGVPASQWLYELLMAAQERARLVLPRPSAAGVVRLKTAADEALELRPGGTTCALVLPGGAAAPLARRDLRRLAAVLERAADELEEPEETRRPTPPGEVLQEFLFPLAMTQAVLAEKLRVSPAVVSGLVTSKRPITPDLALKLAEAFDTTPEFWLSLQAAVDLWSAQQRLGRVEP
jgi:antitoxin HigA-1